jgi:2'-5' RNA ligase
MRLFVAVDVPETIAAALAETSKLLRPAGADVAWIKAGNFHLTLKFMGEVPDGRLGEVKTVLDMVAPRHHAFEMTFYDLGFFPDARKPRILWAGVTAGREHLMALAQDLEKSFSELGFARETHPFAAHLTIGRLRSPRGADRLRHLVERHAGKEFGQCRVEEVRLCKSTLAPGGSVYEALHAARLGA